MDKDRMKGKIKDIKGRVERQTGEWTGDRDTQAKGVKDQVEGKMQSAFGRVKDAARDVKDKAKRRDKEDAA